MTHSSVTRCEADMLPIRINVSHVKRYSITILSKQLGMPKLLTGRVCVCVWIFSQNRILGQIGQNHHEQKEMFLAGETQLDSQAAGWVY